MRPGTAPTSLPGGRRQAVCLTSARRYIILVAEARLLPGKRAACQAARADVEQDVGPQR